MTPPASAEATVPALSGPEVSLPVIIARPETVTFRRSDVDRYWPASRGVRVMLKNGLTFASTIAFPIFHAWATQPDPIEGRPRRDPEAADDVDRGAVLRQRRK